jgi:cytidylate kinase
VLHAHPQLVSARVIAPLTLRAERTAKEQSITPEAARFQVEASDKHRRQYLERFYQANWDDPELYDLVINTAHVAPPEAAGLICQLVLHLATEHSGDTTGGTC